MARFCESNLETRRPDVRIVLTAAPASPRKKGKTGISAKDASRYMRRMKALLLTLAVIFTILGIGLSVLTFRSYNELVVIGGARPAEGRSILARVIELEGEAFASDAIRAHPVRTVEPFRMGTASFRKYEEFQTYSLLAFLFYLSGYTAYYVTRRAPLGPEDSAS